MLPDFLTFRTAPCGYPIAKVASFQLSFFVSFLLSFHVKMESGSLVCPSRRREIGEVRLGTLPK